ncbi:outer membrane protein assembly factor BamA [Sinomicrobium weinanense]|uniref:Outer membrane protein assembly factor BamA n=1 Tax=Sinomicrobium weinanense TaxID=2842200 RepID=A0A926JSX0_9FLAO|nr:outer membrane protein assembly factor BamA [Sinomicrobium weinanense]MBC9796668.1 outer membrane protein assembly factor BamA [Sinomicrobium weinanense]MBU3124918.1 outer membrane protein assembly factor BamA [Sinomicrobium weinanense]
MRKRYFGVIIAVFVLLCNNAALKAQDIKFDKGQKYILGGIEVTGVKSYNKQTVITYSGLRVGQEITVPGEQITNVIKKLWKLELFSDVTFYITRTEGNKVFLELNIKEVPTLSTVKIEGIKKKKGEAVLKEADIKKGKRVTESFITNTRNFLVNKYKKQGFLHAKANIVTAPDTSQVNAVKMLVNIDRGEKVKVKDITFSGNEALKSKTLRKAMKNTKRKMFGRFWKKSKFIPEDYKTDLTSLVDKYKERGYRDARIIADTVIDNKTKKIGIHIDLEEGNKYYFGKIDFVGNTVWSDRQLSSILGIEPGDTYNGVLLRKRIADETKPDAEDITNTYQNNGYLFSTINPVEVSAENDTIDFEIRITEGKLAYFNDIRISGNDKTNDHVIYRELRTRPGQKYSKENVIRTIRELGQLGYFDPEAIAPEIKNANPNAGTVDVEYALTEKGSSQIELQGGYGGGGFIGTLGLSFSNFSIKDLFKKDAYKPVPMGDGQTLALRLQASRFYQTYSFSFSEPWLGGKKPTQFSASLSHSRQFYYDPYTGRPDKDQRFYITSFTLGLAKRLEVPDDYFSLSHALSFQYYDLQNYPIGLFGFGSTGFAKNIAYTVALSRNNTYINPIYPLGGSKFTISLRVTPPYSLFDGVDYGNLGDKEEFWSRDEDGNIMKDDDNNPIPDQEKIAQEKIKWLEFYKIKFDGEWYTKLVDKLVLKTQANFGYLGAYNQDRDVVPFERFYLGGDGMANYTLDSRETIALRGYPNQSLSGGSGTRSLGSTIYNKFSLELRYPLTLKPSASIYGLVFAEGGAAFDEFKDYNPFQLKRSAGFGLRIFMPAFGLLGIDFGHGFDSIDGTGQKNGWETHFIIGQQF